MRGKRFTLGEALAVMARAAQILGEIHAASIVHLDICPSNLVVREADSELTIIAPDAPGVLAAIAGALTASRLDVLGAVLGHVDLDARRLVTDTFFVRDLKGDAIPDDDARWTRLATDLRDLLATAPDPAAVADLIAKRRPRSGMPPRITPAVPTWASLAPR